MCKDKYQVTVTESVIDMETLDQKVPDVYILDKKELRNLMKEGHSCIIENRVFESRNAADRYFTEKVEQIKSVYFQYTDLLTVRMVSRNTLIYDERSEGYIESAYYTYEIGEVI